VPAQITSAIETGSNNDGLIGTSPLATGTAGSQTQSVSGQNVSKGAVAGATVSGFIAGAIVAALIVWLVSSRRRKKYLPIVPVTPQGSDKASLSRVTGTGAGKGLEPGSSSEGGSGGAVPLSSLTTKGKRDSLASAFDRLSNPMETPDRTFSELKTQVKTLFDQIDMHVDNFYSSAAMNAQLTEDQQHCLRQVDSPFLPDSVIGLLPESTTSSGVTLIRHCLNYAIFSRLDSAVPSSTESETLFSSGLLSVLSILGAAEDGTAETRGQEQEKKLQWKSATIEMVDAAAVVKSGDIQSKISRLVHTCVRAFEPWAVPRYGSEARRSHLARIMEEAVELGLHMFGERDGWLMWQWEVNPIRVHLGDIEPGMLVSPGLELRKGFHGIRTGPIASGESGRELAVESISTTEVILHPTTARL
jgi:hypothetical protein